MLRMDNNNSYRENDLSSAGVHKLELVVFSLLKLMHYLLFDDYSILLRQLYRIYYFLIRLIDKNIMLRILKFFFLSGLYVID